MPTSRYLSKGNKNLTQKDICTGHVYWSTVYNSQDVDTTWVSIKGWMDKEDGVGMYNGIFIQP